MSPDPSLADLGADVHRAMAMRLVRARRPLAPAGDVRATVDGVIARLEGFGPLDTFLAEPAVSEVMVNGPGPVWVERSGRLERTSLELDRPAIDLLVERVVAPLGLRADRTNPVVDARLPDGSRVHVVLPPLAVDGPAVTIRRFGAAAVPLGEFCSPGVAEYLAERPPLPRWADADLMRAGEDFFNRWGLYVPLVLVCSSLPECYAAKKGVQVLQLTARLATDPKRRIVETAQMVLDVMAPGGLQPGARGYQTVRRVRLMHAGVRCLIQNDPRIARGDAAASGGARWDPDWGVPINQEDLAGTLTTFSWSVLVGLAALGVPVSDDEQDAFIHTWNVVGAMLGLREELLPKDADDAAALSSRIRERQWEESEEGREMTQALLEMLDESLPGRVIPGFGPSMIRHFIGDDVATQLGVPRAGRAGSMFRSAALLANSAGLTQQRSWVFRKTAAVVSRGLLQSYMRFDRGGDRPEFDIPVTLAGVRGPIVPRPRMPRLRRR